MIWKSIFIFSNGEIGLGEVEAFLDPHNKPIAPMFAIFEDTKYRQSAFMFNPTGVFPVYVEPCSKATEKFGFRMAKKQLEKLGFQEMV